MFSETTAAARVFAVWILFAALAVLLMSMKRPEVFEQPVAILRGPTVQIDARAPRDRPQARLRPSVR